MVLVSIGDHSIYNAILGKDILISQFSFYISQTLSNPSNPVEASRIGLLGHPLIDVIA